MMGPETPSGFTPSLPSEIRSSLPLSSSSSSSSSPSIYRSAIGNDPFLFPSSSFSSSSSSSSSSFLDPPSYADAIFRPFDPPHGNHSSPANPSAASSPSLYLEISVSDPQKESDSPSSLVPGAGAFVTYLITTRVPAASSPFAVRRRFRDFVTLSDRLAESFRGFFVPIRPDKSVVDAQVMQKHEFLEQRRAALEKYLRRLAAHPAVGRGEELRVFLRAQGRLPLPPTTDVASRVLDGAVRLPRQLFGEGAAAPQGEAAVQRGGRDLLRMFKELKQSVANDWGGAKPALVEEDKEFLERRGRMQELGMQISATSEQAEALVKAQHDTGETMGELGLAFIKLIKLENDEAIYVSQRVGAADAKIVATAAVKASRFYRELNSQTIKHLDTLHEYMGLMLSIRNAFSERSDALLTVQTLLSDLTSLHARAEKLEAASARVFGRDESRIQKLEEIRRTVVVTEDAKDCATREYERIKENNRNELERFDKEKHDDFLCMLRGLAINQAGYFEKIADVWGTVARETSHYAKDD